LCHSELPQNRASTVPHISKQLSSNFLEYMIMRKSRCYQQGVHLLDLIIAILLITIIGAGSIPSLRALLYTNELKRQANLLRFRLETVLTESILHGQESSVSFGGSWYQISSQNSGSPVVFALPESIRAKLNSGHTQTIKFHSSGVASPTTIEVSSKNQKCQLTLSLRGRLEQKCDA
jgi:Tfp pilus assembly protein FimT